MKIDVLIGCEESQAVTIEFRKLVIKAFSCDLLPCSGGKPEWHLQKDIFKVIEKHPEIKMGIFFPPCTHLAVSGAMHFKEKIADGRQQEGIDFFLKLANCNIPKTAIENPIGIMSNNYRKPNQIIQPYFFGDVFTKTTCLWLKNLPLLQHNDKPNLFDYKVTHVEKGEFFEWTDGKTGKTKKQPLWYYQALLNSKTPEQRRTLRSKTFPGIAKAMAKQWIKEL